MNIIRIANATRELGRAQGYVPLPLRDDVITTDDNGMQLHVMTAAFEILPDELERLKQGATIYLSIYGTMLPQGATLMEHIQAGSAWPPVYLTAGPVPVEEPDEAPSS